MKKPVIALTTGDPTGVGPEISLRVAALKELRQVCRLILVGDAITFESIRSVANYTGLIRTFSQDQLDDVLATDPGDEVELLDCNTITQPIPLGAPSAEGGRACYTYITNAIDNALAGRFHGVATAPISKLSLKKAGIDFIGHTEIFGERTNTASYAMMMYSERLAVGLVTCHQSLASVPMELNKERIVEVGKLLSESVEKIRGVKPNMAVLGLNPHAGEGGMLGTEEMETVMPAIEELKALGCNPSAPLPPDTAFTKKALQTYQAHLCLYHDQGLIPFKMISFDDGVNVTMGLPFPRTSVDHGTAYDIAGKGIAEITSLISAIKLAAKLA